MKDNHITITIFTPTYNRAYTLDKLYDSLCDQTDRDFTWLIVDDGSTDETKELVYGWINEKKITIEYYYQENSGKPQAHNKGVQEAKSLLFTCVDSDDWLIPQAVEQIKKTYKENDIDVGILCKRGTSVNDAITSWRGDIIRATMFEAEKKHKLRGDTMLIFRTSYLKDRFFPRIEGEKFIPESYLYDQLSGIGKLYFLDEILYICEYLPDGYTNNMRQINKKNPRGYLLYINQRLNMDETLLDKIKDTLRYVAIKKAVSDKNIVADAVYPMLAFLCYIPASVLSKKIY